MKKISYVVISILLSFFVLVSCTKNKAEEEFPTIHAREIELAGDVALGSFINEILEGASYEEADDFDENNPMSASRAFVYLSDGTSTITDENGLTYDRTSADVSGNTVIIQRGGTYEIGGELSNGQIIVGTDDLTQLVFVGASIHSESAPAIEMYGKGKKILTLAEGSENSFSDGDKRVDPTKDAVIFSENTVTINGSGKMTISSRYKNGITAGAIKLLNCKISVPECKSKAIQSHNYCYVKFAALDLVSQDDGMYCLQSAAFVRSKITFFGGGITARDVILDGTKADVKSDKDGLNATRLVSVSDSEVLIEAKNDGVVSYGEEGVARLIGSDFTISDGDDGIKSDYLSVASGTLFCAGMGAQINVGKQIESYVSPKEVFIEEGIKSGVSVIFGRTSVTLERECRFLVYVGTEWEKLNVGETSLRVEI